MNPDHFSAVAKQYVQSRPTYPPGLFEWLAHTCSGCGLAWDVGAGNGQASIGLAAHFQRVLKPNGLLAVWTYGALQIADREIEARVSHYYHDVVGPYWPPERRHVESAYASLPFPFQEVPPPALTMRRDWTLDDLLGYCRSWSATARLQNATGVDPVPALDAELEAVWGDRLQARPVTWPIALRAGFRTPA